MNEEEMLKQRLAKPPDECESIRCRNKRAVVLRHKEIAKFQIAVCQKCADVLMNNGFEICPQDEMIHADHQNLKVS